MSKLFKRKKEDFKCDHCGFSVTGSGYTNHCPNCLWSKHVDINPGDRANDCKGLMQPIGLELSGGEKIIVFKCIKCGEVKRCKSDEKDNFDVILEISKNIC